MSISFGPYHEEKDVLIQADNVTLEGALGIPPGAKGVVLFAHGSGSSRLSIRNRHVAQILRNAGIGTLLFDLLTRDEEAVDQITGRLRFDIPFLALRLGSATKWLRNQPEAHELPFGYFGASTGGGAALVAAADMPDQVSAVVSRGGRPDLAGEALKRVQAPTLLIVGGEDTAVIRMNQDARREMRGPVELAVVPGATHLFEEPGTLEEVAKLAVHWFDRHLGRQPSHR
jgi:dienelactone hydrolase